MPDVLVHIDLFNLSRETRQKYFAVLSQNCQDYVKRKIVSSPLRHPLKSWRYRIVWVNVLGAVRRCVHPTPHTPSNLSGSTFLFLSTTGRGDMEQNESDNRRIIRYPDSHQLFVGNLPHDIDESELKEFFMSK